MAASGDAARVEKIVSTRRTASVSGVAGALVSRCRGAVSRFPARPILNEQLGHVINRRYPPDSDRVPFAVFWLEHLAFFPAVDVLYPGGVVLCRERRIFRGARVRTWAADLVACWFGVTAVSILFSSLQDYYLMTAWGPVALWLARPWAGDPDARARTAALDDAGARPGVMAGIGMLACWRRRHGSSVHAGVRRVTGRNDWRSPPATRMLGTLAGFSRRHGTRLRPLLWGTGAVFSRGGWARRGPGARPAAGGPFCR